MPSRDLALGLTTCGWCGVAHDSCIHVDLPHVAHPGMKYDTFSTLLHEHDFEVRKIRLACITACFCCMQVVQTDEAVFDAVRAKFATLTASLLPKLVCLLAPAFGSITVLHGMLTPKHYFTHNSS